jgi:Rad3-related DNA helicase
MEKSGEAVILKLTALKSSLTNLIVNLDRFIDGDHDDWIAFSDTDRNLIIKPMSAAGFAEQNLFSTAQNILLMSATILDFKTFRRNLGIPFKQSNSLSVPSDFPKENRRIVFWPAGNMSYKDIEATLPKMAERVGKLLTKYGDRKGIIHTHSYRINSYLLEYLSRTDHKHRVVTHNSDVGSREAAIQKHCSSPLPTVLISPSMTEGLDLKGDLSRFQIIVKTPFPFLDPYNKARMERDPQWYQMQTALTLVQATGRSVRSIEDHAITIILDSGFERFLVQNQEILPEWWKESLEFK